MTAAGPSSAQTAAAARVPSGRWYPDMPPKLPGEDTPRYEARLTAGDGPFDHRRSDDCARGRHGTCPGGRFCQCPHHADQAPGLTTGATAALDALSVGAAELAARYQLPEATGLRLMVLTREVACGGRRPPSAALKACITAAYDSVVSDQFTAAVAAIYHAAVTGDRR